MFIRKIQSTHLVFLLIVLLVTAWILSGQFNKRPTPAPLTPSLATVATNWSEAKAISRELVVYGDIEPFQVARVKARTQGIVESIVKKGDVVKKGDELARLSMDDRAVRLAQAETHLLATERDYNAVKQLITRDLSSESERQLKLAQLESARAGLRAIEFEIENTHIRAPIDGMINQILVDQGSLVNTGGDLLEIIDNDPLLAVIHVQQEDVAKLKLGQQASVRFIGDLTRQGKIRFISPIGDTKTRTFRVEIEIDNHTDPLPSGLSAEVSLTLSTEQAHSISPALIRLDQDGQIGVFTVNGSQIIEFKPINVVRADGQNIWVSGLADKVQLITLSQGTLSNGQSVQIRPTPNAYLMPAQENH